MPTAVRLAATATVAIAMIGCAGPATGVMPTPKPVIAAIETAPVLQGGDAADDPAVWVHPAHPALSLVIGNNKKGSLEVYDLQGNLRQRITTSKSFWGNVDVRSGVRVGGRVMDVVAVQNGGIRTFTVDEDTRTLLPVGDGDGVIKTAGGEGLCLYRSPRDDALYALVTTRAGVFSQYLVHDGDGDGRLEGTRVRQFAVGSEAEGCVADDEHGDLYISQEDVGLWRYGAEPASGAARTRVDSVQPDGHLAADVEGVTLIDTGGGGGYLIASAQNVRNPRKSYFTVYDRRSNDYVGAFRVVDGPTTDGCERTDGIAAYAGSLGPDFPKGVFVCQDNTNASPGPGNQNFKLVPLERVIDLG